MEDIGKAIIMATNVLMFAFAATVSIYLYNTLTYSIDEIMLASNYSNRGDLIIGVEDTDYTRTVKKAEIVMAILDLKDKYEKTYDDSYKVKVGSNIYQYNYINDEIKINGISVGFDSTNFRLALNNISNSDYKLIYDSTGKVLEYTLK